MNRTYREPYEYEEVMDNPEREVIHRALYDLATYKSLMDIYADIMGPLGTRERWNMLENANFPKVMRRKVKLVGSADEASISLVNLGREWGYPADVLLLELADIDKIQTPNFDHERVSSAMDKLLKSRE